MDAIDLAFYRHQGHLTVNGVFGAAETDALIADIEAWGESFLADAAGRAARLVRRRRRAGAHGAAQARQPARAPAGGAEAARDPRLVALVEQILGRGVSVYFSQIFFKAPEGGGPKPAHQDNFYFGPTDIEGVVTAWIALDDATLENGCLYFGDGTNHGPGLRARRSAGRALQPAAARRRCSTKQPMAPAPVRKGGVSFHHGNTFHQSGPNHSTRWRRACALHYVRNGVEFATPHCYDHAPLRQSSSRSTAVHVDGSQCSPHRLAPPRRRLTPSRAACRCARVYDAERLVRLHVERARMRQLDREVVGHARRPGGEDDDAGAEEDRLRDAVGDEQDRLAGLPSRCAAARGSSSRASARRARRTARPSAPAWGRGPARARSPRAAACRPRARRGACPRRPRGRPARAGRAPARGSPSPAGRGSRPAAGRCRGSCRHFSSSGCWNTMPMSRAGSNGTASPSRSSPSPASCGCRPARIFSSVLLPQPDGPTSAHELARHDVEARVGDREVRLARRCRRSWRRRRDG